MSLAFLLSACGDRDAGKDESQVGSTVNVEEQQRVQAEASLAALGGPATAEQRALYQGDFTASGSLSLSPDEGAWDLELVGDAVQFIRPGLSETIDSVGARDFREQGMRVMNANGTLVVTIRHEECPLANGTALPYRAEVLFEGVAYNGCARQGVSSADRPTWAADLAQLIPAIDACLARVSSRPGRVTQASFVEDNQVAVRVREADGGRYACAVAATGAGPVVYEPIFESDRLPGEGDPEFVRAPGTAPRAGNCRTVTEAMAPTGESLGWLLRRTC